MKTLNIILILCFVNTPASAQLNINVPNFSDPAVKSFYQSYSTHLLKCIEAIHEKNEAKAVALFKNPGEQLIAGEKIIAKELTKNSAEKQKYIEYAKQVYPYIKEVERSIYYQKIYGR